jgi:L-galactose dehydrogenase
VEYRRLGKTELRVSLLGLGSGGKSKLGQTHGMEQSEITPIVRRALDLGVNVIDTAPGYDESEALLGNALDGVPRDSYVMCSKFWPVREGKVLTVEAFHASVDRSLKRLKTDTLDVLYLHGVAPNWLEPSLEALYPAMQDVQRAGKVRFLGITETFATDDQHLTMQAVLPRDLFDVVMVGYNVLSAAPALHVLPLAQKHDVGVVIMCAVRGVLLSQQRIREVVGEWMDAGLLARDAVPADDPLGWVLGPWADTIPTAAYKFAADHAAVSTVLTGTGRVAHLEANAEAILGGKLPTEIVDRLIQTFGPVSRNASF